MSKKLWGGRFEKATHPLVEEFTRSIQYDYKLAKYDIAGSITHVQILRKADLLTQAETAKLIKGLHALAKKVLSGTFTPDMTVEDIHSCIQNELEKTVGGLAMKLHTARSRNDQVVFATKMYCKDTLKNIQKNIEALISAFAGAANKNKDVIVPGVTHMQHAQPVYVKDFFAAYSMMLRSDCQALADIDKKIKLTLGAGALAGTPIPAAKYGLYSTANSLYAVSDRDFVLEILSALSIAGMHLSRLAEDLIIWATNEFDFIELDEAFCTGSSLMPQKKNPDVLELIRGYAGRLYGNLISVFTMMKGLPLTYNRDMQLDKEPLFNSFEIVSSELKVLAGIINTLKFNKEKIASHLKDEALYATDLVYYLVYKNVPFKTAHTIVGKLVKYSIVSDINIKDMPEGMLKKFSDKFIKKEILKVFNPKVSVESKKSIKRT